MHFYRIDLAGQHYVFLPFAAETEALPAADALSFFPSDAIRILLFPSLRADYLLKPVDGEIFVPDLLRAFAVFLSSVRGLPSSEAEAEIGDRRYMISVPAAGAGECALFSSPVGKCRLVSENGTVPIEGRALGFSEWDCGGLHRLFLTDQPELFDFPLLTGMLSRPMENGQIRGSIAFCPTAGKDGARRFVFCPAFSLPSRALDSRAAAVCAAYLLRRQALGKDESALFSAGPYTARVRADAARGFHVASPPGAIYTGKGSAALHFSAF